MSDLYGPARNRCLKYCGRAVDLSRFLSVQKEQTRLDRTEDINAIAWNSKYHGVLNICRSERSDQLGAAERSGGVYFAADFPKTRSPVDFR